jgi:hypothetical protein
VQKHYDITDWLDLLRGVTHLDRLATMESHRLGCSSCRDTIAWAQRLLSAARSDHQIEVPTQVIHNARAIFALRRLDAVKLRTRLLARLTFDSFNQPALQGVRSEQRSDVRHLLYEIDPYLIDLRLEHERGAAAISMIGQIHHAAHLDARVPQMPITLTANEEIVATTVCNEFGEFALEYASRSSLCLQLGGEEDSRTEI